jgi:hypothetical protein
VFLTKRANERQPSSLSSAFISFFSVLLSAAFEHGYWEGFYEANDETPLTREERCYMPYRLAQLYNMGQHLWRTCFII